MLLGFKMVHFRVESNSFNHSYNLNFSLQVILFYKELITFEDITCINFRRHIV